MKSAPVLDSKRKWLVPDVALRELSSKPESKIRGYATKLRDFVDKNKQNIYVGKYWSVLERRLSSPDEQVSPKWIVSHEYTDMLRNLDVDEFAEVCKAIAERNEIDSYEEHRIKFLKIADDYVAPRLKKYNESMANKFAGNIDSQIEMIRRPEAYVEWLRQFYPKRYLVRKWDRAVRLRGISTPASRFVQAALWIAFRRLAGRKDPNDWDDAHYVVLACFTGCLLTNDQRMKGFARALDPEIECLAL